LSSQIDPFSKRFSNPGLAISEAGGLGALEGFTNEGQHTGSVNILVALFTVEKIVKLELTYSLQSDTEPADHNFTLVITFQYCACYVLI
jgi:hypothetical protein